MFLLADVSVYSSSSDVLLASNGTGLHGWRISEHAGFFLALYLLSSCTKFVFLFLSFVTLHIRRKDLSFVVAV